jgi:hypothetical protein
VRRGDSCGATPASQGARGPHGNNIQIPRCNNQRRLPLALVTTRLEAMLRARSRPQRGVGLADRPDLSAGVLDFDLGNADSSSVCWKLVRRRIPFVFYRDASTPHFSNGQRSPSCSNPQAAASSQRLLGCSGPAADPTGLSCGATVET